MNVSVAARQWYKRQAYSSSHVHVYFASDAARVVQSALGLFWIIDGALQLLPFASTPDGAGFLAGQPSWLAPSLAWVAALDGPTLAWWHAVVALAQVVIGVGLLARPTVKAALASSVGWGAILWWLGGSFGMLFSGTASPLTAAPGAAVLIMVLALLAWPNGRPGGLLGDRGARAVWAVLWVGMAWLWLRAADGGDVIALVCAGASALVGCAVGIRWHARTFLWTAVGLNIVYWVVGEGFAGLVAGEGVDAGSGPLFIVFAGLLFTLFPVSAATTVATGEPPLTEAALSRRTVLTTVGVAGTLAAIAVIADVAGAFGRGGGGGTPFGGPLLGTHHKNDHGDDGGHSNDNGNGSQSGNDPNSGIQTLTSQAPLPPQFTSNLPIPHQLQPTRKTGDTDYYEITQSAATADILPGLKTPIWGYNGTFPGPTIVQNPGRNVVVTHHNNLPAPTVVHLHGGAVPHDSDGYPTDFVLPAESYGEFPAMPAMGDMPAMTDPKAVTTRQTRDYTYPQQPRAATLWYHDHRMDFTGASVYRGLAGFHLAHDAEERGLPLPQGDRDVPLMIADRAFAADGSFLYPALDPTMRSTPGVEKDSGNGVMGDVILVNGAAWPVFQVDTARYRFRILNASNARTMRLALDDAAQGAGFVQIGTDQGLLASPQSLDTIDISPAQRFDVVIDFSKHKVGDQITLTNQLGSGSTAVVMRFQVARATTDTSSVPATLSQLAAITPDSSAPTRTMKFHRAGADWEINGRIFDPTYSEADVRAGGAEVWTVTSDFHHPFHVHNCAMQVVSRDGQAPGPYDQGLKDTVFLNKGEKVQIAIRFSSYQGRYVFHCHNLEHEDMGMMANFTIN
jgi:spore coat protein A